MTTKKKCSILVGMLIGCICLALSIINAISEPRSGVTKANVDRIKVGMSYSDVTSIFARDSDQSFAGPGVWTNPDLSQALINWDLNKSDLRVKEAFWVPRPDTTLFDKLRRWLGLAQR